MSGGSDAKSGDSSAAQGGTTKETTQPQLPPKGERVPPAPTTMPGKGEFRRDGDDTKRPLPTETTMPGAGDKME